MKQQRAAPSSPPCPELPLHAALSPLGDQGHSKPVVLATWRSQTHREGVHESSKTLWAGCPVGWCLSQSPALSHKQKNHGKKQLSQTSQQRNFSVQETSSRSIFPPQRVTRGQSFSNQRFKASQQQQQHTRAESPPHFPSCSPGFHTKTAEDSQPLQRAGEMRTSTCEPQPELNEPLFLSGPL